MSKAKTAAVPHAQPPKNSFTMPPHLATGGTTLFEAPATAKAAVNAMAKAFGTLNAQNLAKVQSGLIGPQNVGHVRPPNVPKLLLGPSLTQQKANQTNAAAAKMGAVCLKHRHK